MKKIVWAYITRQKDQQLQILVCRKFGCSAASWSVPGGETGRGENEIDALYRHVEDQTGLVHLNFIGKLDSQVFYQGCLKNSAELITFEVESLESPSDKWTFEAYDEVRDCYESKEFSWLPLSCARLHLPFEQGKALSSLMKNPFHLPDNRNRLQSGAEYQIPRSSPL
ncbi:MAG: NUDIX hydrolase [Bacteroidota bacterium]